VIVKKGRITTKICRFALARQAYYAREEGGNDMTRSMRALIILAVFVCIAVYFQGPAAAQSLKPSTYLEAATRVIEENNRIDNEIQDVKKNADVTIRPVHVTERLKKANNAAYAIWPRLFTNGVPEKYADLYMNLQKLVKLQMQRTCLICDIDYACQMKNQATVKPYREELCRVEERYFKQKKLVNKIYASLK
jgi:hypothetical protein